jgi:hypothetical protein
MCGDHVGHGIPELTCGLSLSRMGLNPPFVHIPLPLGCFCMAQENQTESQAIVRCAPMVTTGDTPLNFLDLRWPDQSAGQGFAASCEQLPAPIAYLQKMDAKDQVSAQSRDQVAPTAKDQVAAPTKDQVAAPMKGPVDNARDHLSALADSMVGSKAMKQKDGDHLKADMAAFEARAGQAGLDASEIAKTYENVSRLIESTGQSTVDQPSRIKIAEQALHHVAYPTEIDQGRHDTCNVSTVEVRTFMRYPSAATKLIADVATTGSYTSADGTKITIDAKSLKTDEESSQNPTPDRERSYASQIFQIAAANVYWQRQEEDPAGNYATKGSLRFEQDPSKRGYFTNDTGERLMAYWSNPPKELSKGPAMGASALKDIADQISGKSDDGFVIENKIKGGPNTVQVSSEKDLRDALIDIKKGGQLPAIIRVHTGNEPFLSDQGGTLSRSKGVWHVVSVTAFDEQTGKVSIDNQWGKSSDHQMKIGDLYNATLEPKQNSWQMIHESTAPTIHIHWPWGTPMLPENELWLH